MKNYVIAYAEGSSIKEDITHIIKVGDKEILSQIIVQAFTPNISRDDINSWDVIDLNNGKGIISGFRVLAVLDGRNLVVSYPGTGFDKSLVKDTTIKGITFSSARFMSPEAVTNKFSPLLNTNIFDYRIFGDNGKYKDYITNYRIEWDPVSSSLVGMNLGVTIELEDKISGDVPALGAHSLYNFYGHIQ